MAAVIGSLRAELSASVAKFVSDVGRAGKSVVNLGADFKTAGKAIKGAGLDVLGWQKGIVGLGRELGGLGRMLGSFAGKVGALLGIGGAAGIVIATREAVNYGSELVETSTQIGIATDHLQALRFQAALTGVEQAALNTGLGIFTRTLGQAINGSAEAERKFGALGVRIRDARGQARPTIEVLEDVADGIARITSESQRNAQASAIFGRGGIALINQLREGSAGMRAAREEAERLGIVLDEKLLVEAEAAGDALDIMGMIIDANVKRALLGFAPVIIDASEYLADNADQIKAWSEDVAERIPDAVDKAKVAIGEIVDEINFYTDVALAVIAMRLAGQMFGPYAAAGVAVAAGLDQARKELKEYAAENEGFQKAVEETATTVEGQTLMAAGMFQGPLIQVQLATDIARWLGLVDDATEASRGLSYESRQLIELWDRLDGSVRKQPWSVAADGLALVTTEADLAQAAVADLVGAFDGFEAGPGAIMAPLPPEPPPGPGFRTQMELADREGRWAGLLRQIEEARRLSDRAKAEAERAADREAAEKERAAEQLAKTLQELRDKVDPLAAALRQYATDMELATAAGVDMDQAQRVLATEAINAAGGLDVVLTKLEELPPAVRDVAESMRRAEWGKKLVEDAEKAEEALKDLAEALTERHDPYSVLVKRLEEINSVTDRISDNVRQAAIADAWKEYNDAVDDTREGLERVDLALDRVGQSLVDINGWMTDWRGQTQKLIQDLAQIAFIDPFLEGAKDSDVLKDFFGSLLTTVSGGWSFGPQPSGGDHAGLIGYAAGGTLAKGNWGWVGEEGPELAYAGDADMTIFPNGTMPAGLGGDFNQNITIVTPDAGSFRRTARQTARIARRDFGVAG